MSGLLGQNPWARGADMIKVCPACGTQWHIAPEAAMQWTKLTLRHDDSALSKVLGGLPAVDLRDFDEMLEAVFRAHVASECPHPRLILEMLKRREANG